MGRILTILLLAFSSLLSAQTLTFGVVPQQSALRLAEMWLPLIEEVEQQTGIPIHFATDNTIPDFETSLLKSKYDIAYINPFHFLYFNKKAGYEAIARENRNIYGIIVVPVNSKINNISQLHNKDMIFPAPGAFAASVLIMATLKEAGIRVHPHFVSSHDSVYANIAMERFEAGGGVFRTFNAMSKDIQAKLRIIYETKRYTSHAFAVSKNVPEEIKNKIKLALVNLSKESLEKAALTQLVPAKIEDWDNVQPLFRIYEKEVDEE